MKKRLLAIMLAFFAAWALWGCGDGGHNTSVTVVPPAQQSTEATAVDLTIVDTTTGAPQGVVPAAVAPLFSVSVTGADADKVYDGTGTAMYDPATGEAGPFAGVKDFLTFYLRADPADYPLYLRVVVKGAGYVTNSWTLVVEAPTSSDPVLLPIVIEMTPTSLTTEQQVALNSEVGIDVQSASVAADATGKTTAPLTISTTPIATQTTSADGSTTTTGSGTVALAIPAGTGLMTRDGQPVTGDLTATVTYHNPIAPSSLATYPGGLTVLEQPDGTPLAAGEPPASFITGGLTSVDIVDSSGNEVRNFDTPIVVTMTVPKNLGNPATGALLAAGDQVPLWSYDTDTGEWTVHRDAGGNILQGVIGDGDGDGAVDTPPAQTAGGDWLVAFPTTHLSYFNLDWFAWYQDVPGATALQCSSTPLTVVGAQGQKIFFLAEAVAGGFSHQAWLDANPTQPAQQTVSIYNAPTIPIRYTAYLNSESATNKLNSQVFDNLCQPGGVTFNVDQNLLDALLTTTKFADVTVNVLDRCSNDLSKTTPVPSNGITAYSGTSHLAAITNSQGTAVLNSLVVGQTYTVEAADRNGGTSQTSQVTVAETGNNVDLYFPQACEVVNNPPAGTGGTGGTGGTL